MLAAFGSRSIYLCESSVLIGGAALTYGPQLTSEDSYQIACMGVQGLRVEVVCDSPPPPDEPP